MKNFEYSGVLLKVLLFLAFLVIVVFFIIYYSIAPERNDETLLLVHVVTRHGQRTPDPLTTYPNDIYKNHSYLPEGPGRLTKHGVQEAYNVGKFLRHRYGNFLGPEYYYGLVETISSGEARCRTTTEAILGKLFEWSSLLAEYSYTPVQYDHMITVHYSCPDFASVNASVPEHLCQEYGKIVDVLNKYSGLNVTSVVSLGYFYELFKAQESLGLRLPDWAHQIWPEPLQKCGYAHVNALIDNKKTLSYITGNLLEKIVNDTLRKVAGEIDQTKMYLYAGHDTTIAGLLAVLDLYVGNKIATCEFLMFELHNFNETLGFKVYHENYKGSTPVLLDIPSCGTFCPLEKMIKIFEPHYVRDWIINEARLMSESTDLVRCDLIELFAKITTICASQTEAMKKFEYASVLLKVYLVLFVGVVVYIVYSSIAQSDNNDTLILVHVVARHGQRTPDPLTTYPNDIYKNYNYPPEGPGRLTKKGVQQSYNVGKLLRQRYHKFLGPNYYYGLVEAISSGEQRCRASMQAILGNLYKNSPLIPEYSYTNIKDDHMITVHYSCPDLRHVNASVPEHLCESYTDIVDVLNKYSGLHVSSVNHLTYFYDLFYTQVKLGLTLPDWAHQIWPQPLEKCGYAYITALMDNRKALSYNIGNLMKKIVEVTMRKIADQSEEVKMYMYTGHDTTVAGLLAMLNLYSGQKVQFCEFVIFELHKLNGALGFKIYHENYQGSAPILLDIPFCGTFCSMDEIIALAEIYYPTDWCNFD